MATQDEVNKLVSVIQALKNKDLVNICYYNSLVKSGNKADLQKRIINLIDASVHDPNPQKFQNVRNSILQVTNGGATTPVNYRVPYFAAAGSLPSSPVHAGHAGMSSSPYASGTAAPNGAVAGPGGSADPSRRPPYSHQGLQFKPSPFYEIDTPLGDVRPCDAMTQHRNSVMVLLRASQFPDLQRCLADPTMRVLVFCAAGNYGVQDVAFPYQCEIKVNGGEVKANLRGLKNKPGSTRPVDITDLLRLKPPTYGNSVEFTYALTQKRFYLALYLCKTYSTTVLASQIEKRRRITKASVVREVTRQAQDPDIVATSLVLSLKCPLTYMRLGQPVRATTCKHLQCFDATSYLQLQEQGPQWLCPVCSNAASFESLAVDEYVQDILENTPSDLEQVTIDPDGTWHTGNNPNHGGGGSSTGGEWTPPPPPPSSSRVAAETVDDGLEILSTPGSRRNGGGGGGGVLGSGSGSGSSGMPFPLPGSASATVVGGGSSRATTATPSQAGAGASASTSKKRPREVIDLTLSDDDDDLPQQPFKRQHPCYGASPTPYSSLGGGGGGPALAQ